MAEKIINDIADNIIRSCGSGKMLDIGAGMGLLVCTLLSKGVDAYGFDVSSISAEANCSMPNRLILGDILSLPFEEETFDTTISINCLEHIAPEDIPLVLKELCRVTKKYLYLCIATTQDKNDHLTVEKRDWWEKRLFEAGFRKAPTYYVVNDYEALEQDNWQITILMEKVPPLALVRYPLTALEEERGLHMDMTRDTGSRSDAHIIRYKLALDSIRPGDRVLDAACGLGYGTYLLAQNSQGAQFIGIDASQYAIDYAQINFTLDSKIEYRYGKLPTALTSFADNSVDCVVSFETLEHLEEPVAFLKEIKRILTPGGRIIVSVPNDWSDETGNDPNPYHFHVYTWERLKAEMSQFFILETAIAQTANQMKSQIEKKFVKHHRELRQISKNIESVESEWILSVGMKSPFDPAPYAERIFSNTAHSGHPSLQYAEAYKNPWLMHAMVNYGFRVQSKEDLVDMSDQVRLNSSKDSADYAAALCVYAYQALEDMSINSEAIHQIIKDIKCYLDLNISNIHGIRWNVSLGFAQAKLYQKIGDFTNAIESFEKCSSIDIFPFGVHLATKTTEAFFWAGLLSYNLGNKDKCLEYWKQAVAFGSKLLNISLEDVVLNSDYPNLFHFGDGIREYILAWDYIARCANGIHVLNKHGVISASNLILIQNSFHSNYNAVVSDLEHTRTELIDRTRRLESASKDLVERTQDLEHTRTELIDRTRRLESASKELVERDLDTSTPQVGLLSLLRGMYKLIKK